ncbi:hypothetical protein TWF225_009281 [Orbilia oligospora]|nr:hypothetical protein TWF225_009281 [Orbilia oligospora]KAF3269920.1 hypothetical protein TWF217_008265 [Orbilia oligospora]KAF3270379.1 hypothetical protein TWF128_004156 [Orbilia oligospora]KAF3298133.1 hypothetical protein TWF132_004271 [Orbilia oligospora]
MSTVLLLLLAFILSIVYIFNRRPNLETEAKHRPASYRDTACKTTDPDRYQESEPDLVHTPATLETNELDVEDLDIPFLSKIPLYNPQTRLTYFIPENVLPYHPEGLEIPISVVNRLCKCALEAFEVEVEESGSGGVLVKDGTTAITEVLNPSKMTFYVLEDGSCEVREDRDEKVPEEWVKVPERVVEFLADEIVKWVDGENIPDKINIKSIDLDDDS